MVISLVGCEEIGMIDVFAHVLPPKFLAQMLQIDSNVLEKNSWMKNPLLTDIDKRLATMQPNQQEILSMVNLNPEDFVDGDQAATLCEAANEELQQIASNSTSSFPAVVAMLPMNNIAEAMAIIDSQVINNPLVAGVQLFTRAIGKEITDESFSPLFAKMAESGKPIWLHPVFDKRKSDNNLTFSWEYEQTLAMNQIVTKNFSTKYPGLKIIVHHAGAMVPYFARRIFYIQGEARYEAFKHFYVDTAVLGNSKAIEMAVDFFGEDHVLFGTDTPLGIKPNGPTSVIKQSLDQSNLTSIQKEKIFTGNWQQLIQRIK